MEESSTELISAQNVEVVRQSIVGDQWEQVSEMLPADLEASAKASGALVRRRGISDASVLLRLVLAYAVLDWSLRTIGGWGVLMGLVNISDVAILNRLRGCSSWLGMLIRQQLEVRQIRVTQRPGVRLRIRDATVVSRPGSKGTDWRIHLSYNLDSLCIDGVEVTDAHGGEDLARFPASPDDIIVGDRIYAHAASLGPMLAAGAYVVTRTNWQNLPMWTVENERLDVIAWLKERFADTTIDYQEQAVRLPTPQGRFSVRLTACRLPLEAAERARAKARTTAQKKGHTPDERTLFACGFVLLLTNLPAEHWSTTSIFDLYRLRWQIELVFKRCKSLFHLDELRAFDPALVQTYLLGKLLASLLIDARTGNVAVIKPGWFFSSVRPVSLWRLHTLLWHELHQTVSGIIPSHVPPTCLSQLQRFLCEPPRKRVQQLGRARLFLSRLSVVNVL